MKKFAFRSFAVVAALSFVLAGGLGGLGCERDNSSQTQPSTGAQSPSDCQDEDWQSHV